MIVLETPQNAPAAITSASATQRGGQPVIEHDQDHSEAGDQDAGYLRQPRPFAQYDDREQDREDHLALQHQRRQAGRDAVLHRDEEQAELRHPEREAAPITYPGHPRLAEQEDRRDGGEEEAQRGEQQRWEAFQPDLDDDEIDTPDDNDGEREQQVTRLHAIQSERDYT